MLKELLTYVNLREIALSAREGGGIATPPKSAPSLTRSFTRPAGGITLKAPTRKKRTVDPFLQHGEGFFPRATGTGIWHGSCNLIGRQEDNMKKKIIIALAALIAFSSLGFGNTISFKVGYYIPSLKSDFWDNEFANMNFTKSNFQNAVFAFSYEFFLTKELSFVIGVDTYNKNKTGYYRDYVGIQFSDGDFAFHAQYYDGDYTPSHRLNVSVTPLQFSIKIAPLGRRSKIIPYIGAGVGIYLWSVRMQGDLVDFSDEWIYDSPDGYSDAVYPIYAVDAMEGQNFGRIAIGFQGFAGLQIPIANRLTLELEGKYSYAKGKMGTDPNDGFHGFAPLDLGGVTFSLGINYWF
jgi:opacity protein-like surface antigen